jgi:hypothetical protein
MFSSDLMTISASGTATRASSPSVITVIESQRLSQSAFCIPTMTGQVATARMVAQAIAPRNGFRIQNGAAIRRAVSNTAMTVRASSGPRVSGRGSEPADGGLVRFAGAPGTIARCFIASSSSSSLLASRSRPQTLDAFARRRGQSRSRARRRRSGRRLNVAESRATTLRDRLNVGDLVGDLDVSCCGVFHR